MFYVDLSRSALEGDVLRGLAAVYEEPTATPVWLNGQLLPAGVEEIARGAFEGVPWENGMVRATVNHNPALSLGSTADGRVVVAPSADGLAFEIDLARSADLGRSVRKGIEDGTYKGMSFTATQGTAAIVQGRIVHQKFAMLKEISVVRSPAYAGAIAREAAHQSVREQLLRARYRVLMEEKGQ